MSPAYNICLSSAILSAYTIKRMCTEITLIRPEYTLNLPSSLRHLLTMTQRTHFLLRFIIDNTYVDFSRCLCMTEKSYRASSLQNSSLARSQTAIHTSHTLASFGFSRDTLAMHAFPPPATNTTLLCMMDCPFTSRCNQCLFHQQRITQRISLPSLFLFVAKPR